MHYKKRDEILNIFFRFLTVTNNISLLYLKVNYFFSPKTLLVQPLSYKEHFSQSNEFLTDKIKAVDLFVDVVDYQLSVRNT